VEASYMSANIITQGGDHAAAFMTQPAVFGRHFLAMFVQEHITAADAAGYRFDQDFVPAHGRVC
jgi:hypothetical protein